MRSYAEEIRLYSKIPKENISSANLVALAGSHGLRLETALQVNVRYAISTWNLEETAQQVKESKPLESIVP